MVLSRRVGEDPRVRSNTTFDQIQLSIKCNSRRIRHRVALVLKPAGTKLPEAVLGHLPSAKLEKKLKEPPFFWLCIGGLKRILAPVRRKIGFISDLLGQTIFMFTVFFCSQ